MQIRRSLLTAGMTLFLAFATGHVMQNSDTIVAGLQRLGLQYQKVASGPELPAWATPAGITQAGAQTGGPAGVEKTPDSCEGSRVSRGADAPEISPLTVGAPCFPG